MSNSEDCGAVRIDPGQPVVAGSRGTWRIIYTAGRQGMSIGGSLRIRPPERGMVRWEVGKVTATASRPGASCEVRLIDCHPLTFHWRHAPIIHVDLWGEALEEGDTITVTIGDCGGYSRGYCRRARAQDHAICGAQWDFWADTEGNKSVPPERAHNDPYVQLEPVAMDVLPAAPARFSVVARQPQPGDDTFRVLVAARDTYDNFCEQYEGDIRLEAGNQVASLSAGGGRAAMELPLPDGDCARVTATQPMDELIGTSNPAVAGFADGSTIYFGDLHVMTGEGLITGARGGTDYAFRWARDVGGLDFCAVTNGVARWDEDQAIVEAHDAPGEFAAIRACEIGFGIGHKNVYFPRADVPPPDPTGPDELFASLEGQEALVIPHHTSVCSESSRRTFWTEHDFDTHDPQFERLIEITQNRGSMEREEVGGNVYFGARGSSVWSALQRGMKVGFVGGTDGHRGQPGETGSPVGGLDPGDVVVGGLTAVLATSLTREAIWEALHARRCYATQGQRTLLQFTLDDRPMGSVIAPGEAEAFAERRAFRCRIQGHRRIIAAEIVRSDGVTFPAGADSGLGLASVTGTVEDRQPLGGIVPAGDAVFYYLRVTESDGRLAWSSPVWLLQP